MVDVDKQRETCDQQRKEDIAPPGPSHQKLKQPLLLALQTLYVVLISIPIIVYSIIESFFVKPKSLKGNVVLVTGSGRGLGRGFAMKFAQLGCKVACADINEAINEKTVSEINERYGAGTAIAYTCNVGLPKDIAALRERILQDLGLVDLLVHNAAVIAFTPSLTDFEDFYLRTVITVNLSSHFMMIREFLPDMIKRNQGHIVAVASIAGFMGAPKGSMYVATKHGVMGLMESLYYDLKEIPNNQIKTSVICPYFVNTSELYQKHWDIRIPELSVDQLVNGAVAKIRTNTRIIVIPSCFYYFIMIMKLLPDRLTRIINDIFYAKINSPSMDFQKTVPLYKNLKKSFENSQSEYDES